MHIISLRLYYRYHHDHHYTLLQAQGSSHMMAAIGTNSSLRLLDQIITEATIGTLT